MEDLLGCPVWAWTFTLAVVCLALGSVLGHFVWRLRVAEDEPWWRSFVGIGHLLHARYYQGEGARLRLLALGLSVVGAVLLVVVATAVVVTILRGGTSFCGFEL